MQKSAVSALAFSSDGFRLAAGSRDGFVSIADLQSQALFGRSDSGPDTGESGPSVRTQAAIARLAFSRDGKALAARDAGGTVRLWNLDPEAWVKAGCGLANRNLTKEEWSRYVGDGLRYHATCIEDGLNDLKR
jgi:WD40 repeat protein